MKDQIAVKELIKHYVETLKIKQFGPRLVLEMLDALLKLIVGANGGIETFYQNDGEEAIEYLQNHPNNQISDAATNFNKIL